jgi:hypothetical protein
MWDRGRRAKMATLALGAFILAGFESAARAATPESARGASLPASMIGAWGWDARSCGNANDDGRVVVEARSVAFAASFYALKNIAVRPDGAVRATGAANEEGEEGASKGVIELKLLSPSHSSLRTGAGGLHTYLRCTTGR